VTIPLCQDDYVHLWQEGSKRQPTDDCACAANETIEVCPAALGVEPIGFAEDRRAIIGSPQKGEPMIGLKYLHNRVTSRPAHIGISQSTSLKTILILQPDLVLGW
jgi:hypothetical protein